MEGEVTKVYLGMITCGYNHGQVSNTFSPIMA